MPHKSIRSIGATVVLLGVAVAAVLQMGPSRDPSAIALTPVRQVTSTVEQMTEPDEEARSTTTTTTPLPFVYRMGVLAGISTDNFWAFYGEQPSVWNSYILGPTKPALFKIAPSSSELVPELVRSHSEPKEQSGQWVVELELREDMAWNDGEPITADDMAFTFETVRSLSLGGSWATSFPESVVAMETVSDHTLQVFFAGPPTLAVWPNAVGTAPVMAEHIWTEATRVDSAADLYSVSGVEDVFGGPLAITEISEDLIVSVSNPGYPLGTTPDTIEYHVFEDEAAAVEALIGEEIDTILTPKGLSSGSREVAEASDGIALEVSPANGVRYLGFNLQRSPMAHPAFRAAVALLLDRPGLVEKLGDGSQVAYSFVRESNNAWYDEEAVSVIQAAYAADLETRLAKAVDGLRSIGYSWETEPGIDEDGSIAAGAGLTIDGVAPAPLTILTAGDSYDPARPEYVEEIADTLGLLGFEVRPVVTDFDTVVDLTFSQPEEGPRQYDMYFLGWTLGNATLPDYYRPLFASDGRMNNTGYSSSEFDRLLESYEGAKTVEEAREHLWAMEQLLARDLPYLLLYTTEIAEAYSSDRVDFGISGNIGGIQGRLGGIGDVSQP